MQELLSNDISLRRKTAELIKDACREWGFFQVVNHGMRQELMERTRREFFGEAQAYRSAIVTVNPIPNAFIINLGDQLQVVSNGNYKSVEHRVIVNSVKERVSLALFYNAKGDVLMKPAEQLVTKDHPPLYPPMTFDEYRLYIRTRGPSGKSQVDSLLKFHQ
ncbi:UNVERIFIED_CONTAM: putative 2-oxoglutarate-dependent dioxygenase [Sesamum radiatum]|uniref:2-oxoglutarate-dependent dioxygenase n=1 Tax=Sesamum radiatum TaxID=300843 RepID=A0AAW2LDD4_SESRA